MSHLEYLVALLSIIVGLGLTDLAQSLRELVRPRRTVDWHWLPLVWAAFTFLVAVQVWWNSFGLLQEATAENFLSLLITFLLLYLSCAFALPDPDWEQPRAASGSVGGENGEWEPLDLEAFYFSEAHRRWYFGVLLAFIVTAEVFFQAIQMLEGDGANLRSLFLSGMLGVGLVPLILTDRWWVHAPISVLSFLFMALATVETILL
jgi:hypothetical protein